MKTLMFIFIYASLTPLALLSVYGIDLKRDQLIAFGQWLTAPFIPPLSGDHYGETIVLDNRRIVGATFERCRFVYGGGKITLIDVKSFNTSVTFFGAAGSTLELLQQFDKGKGMLE